jgi:hypothetical protein
LVCLSSIIIKKERKDVVVVGPLDNRDKSDWMEASTETHTSLRDVTNPCAMPWIEFYLQYLQIDT